MADFVNKRNDLCLTQRVIVILLLVMGLFMAKCNSKKAKPTENPAVTIDEQTQDDIGFTVTNQEIAPVLKAVLDTAALNNFFPAQQIDSAQEADLRKFYALRNYELAWSKDGKSTPQIDQLLEMLTNAADDGLNPAVFEVNKLEYLRNQAFDFDRSDKVADLIALDLQFTSHYFVYASQLANGRIDPRSLTPKWRLVHMPKDVLNNLMDGLEAQDVTSALKKLAPNFGEYQKLKFYLNKYTKQAAQRSWPKVTEGVSLHLGDTSVRLLAVRERLFMTEDLYEFNKNDNQNTLFDTDLQKAIVRFQARHGLQPDGILGKQTVRLMNVPITHRLAQIIINMERLRWFSDSLDSRFVYINVPAYSMRVYEQNEPILELRIVVGNELNATPVFSATMNHIIFAPYWNLPYTISTKEILPLLQKNPGYLAKAHIELLSGWEEKPTVINPWKVNWHKVTKRTFFFRLRQKPGPWNELGRVKFMFPNILSVYLHGTPAGWLFGLPNRSQSHGCIRLERPEVFAQYLLPELTPDSIQSLMNRPKPHLVFVPKPIRVYIVYMTAWVDKNNEIAFRDDIYGFDSLQLKAIQETDNRYLTVFRP